MRHSDKCHAQSAYQYCITHTNIIVSGFALHHLTVPYKPWYQNISNNTSFTWYIIQNRRNTGRGWHVWYYERWAQWPHMPSDVYMIVGDCRVCDMNLACLKRKRPLKLFRACGPLEIVAMDILVLLPYTTTGNQFILVIMDQYTKLARAIQSKKLLRHMFRRCLSMNWLYHTGFRPFCSWTAVRS